MATGRHLEDDFKLKKWYHKWIERFWNTRKTYLTLVYAIKITKLAYFRVFKMAAGGHLWCSNCHFNYIVTSLGIFHIFEITRNVWWFHIPWLAKKNWDFYLNLENPRWTSAAILKMTSKQKSDTRIEFSGVETLGKCILH